MSTSITITTVICYTCQQPTPQHDAWLVRLMVPSGIYRDGKEIWRMTGESAHVCSGCYFQEAGEEKE